MTFFSRLRWRAPRRAAVALAAFLLQPGCKQSPAPDPPEVAATTVPTVTNPIGSGVPPLEVAREAALRLAPVDARIDLAARIAVRSLAIPLVALSYPVNEPLHPYLAIEKDYMLRLMVFLARDPTIIEAHPFLRPTAPADDIWEDIGCGKLKLLPLGKENRAPVVLAQNCWHEGKSLYHYAIFDEACFSKPKTGTATWSFSAYPDAPHEAFVPNDDPEVHPGISSRRGDGETVLEGLEGRRVAGKGLDAFEVRSYRAVWRGADLVYEYGAWKPQR